jgi:hypothetical protein
VWHLFGLLIVLAIAVTVDAAQPQNKSAPTSAPTTRLVRRRVIVLPTTKPASSLPGLEAQERTLQKIKEIYAADYADSSFNGRRLLARRLMNASDETRKDSDAKFVLLREARNLAAGAGDVTTAFDAVDDLLKTFPVSRLSERVDVMKLAVPALSSVQANLAAASICVDLADQCVVEGDYERADLLLELATTSIRQARSVPYARWIEARTTALRPYREAYEAARPAENVLMQSPNDPDANTVMGKFVSFIKGDLDAGLTMLEKGSDTQFAHLAGQDLDNPETPQAQLKLASDWWEMADQQPPEFRSGIRQRAGYWYRKASGGLDGLDKALAERRLLELNPPPVPGAKKRVEHPPDALLLQPGRWYRASIAEVSWDAAQRLCQQSGGQLVSIETRAEGELMNKLARGRTLWLGASADQYGRWKWLSGAEMFYSNWSSGEPANTTPDSHPVTSASGTWKTSTGKAGFICEWRE